MNNKLGFFVISILVLAAFAPLSKIYINEPISRGQENELFVVVSNDLNRDFEDVKVRIFIYDMGIALYSSGFDLEDNSNTITRFYWTPDNIPAGDYLAKVEISNDNFKDSRHIYLPVR